MTAPGSELASYRKVEVETASQGKLIVMLFNGAIQRAEEARRQLERGKSEGVHNNLVRAQDIINELRVALDMKAGNIARSLDRVYEYLQHLLIRANIRKDTGPIAECVAHLTELRNTWQQAFEEVAKEQKVTPPLINQHGAAVINVQG
ncbi:MAG: flagellar export chaperone FliS [Candidatus Hydrogenedentes bacterium]|nr:flagellar export chaperone FliS [Candidatus Hydrogenedentota bacterium]